MSTLKRKAYDLDLDADVERFLAETPVYCPVPWCTAHDRRYDRCGDVEGPYEGLHVARERAAKLEPARLAREAEALRAEGLDPTIHQWISRMLQDRVDYGDAPGRKGRRRLWPA